MAGSRERTSSVPADDHVRWLRKEGKGYVIDVKIERMPRFRWSWRLLSSVSIDLVSMGSEMISAAYAAAVQKGLRT